MPFIKSSLSVARDAIEMTLMFLALLVTVVVGVTVVVAMVLGVIALILSPAALVTWGIYDLITTTATVWNIGGIVLGSFVMLQMLRA